MFWLNLYGQNLFVWYVQLLINSCATRMDLPLTHFLIISIITHWHDLSGGKGAPNKRFLKLPGNKGIQFPNVSYHRSQFEIAIFVYNWKMITHVFKIAREYSFSMSVIKDHNLNLLFFVYKWKMINVYTIFNRRNAYYMVENK